MDVDRSGAKEYVQGYVKYFIDCHVAFLRIDFLSWYEDGMDKGKQIGRNHGSANYRKVLEWIKEAAGDQIMISLVMPHLKTMVRMSLAWDRWRVLTKTPVREAGIL